MLLALTGYSYAQKTAISEADLDAVIKKSLDARQRLVSYRIRNSLVFFYSGREIKTLTEHVTPGRSRTVVERKERGKRTVTETIWIDKSRYIRVNDGTWTVTQLSTPSGDGSGSGSASVTTGNFREPPKIEQEFEYIGRKDLNGRAADVYEKVIRRTQVMLDTKIVTVETSTYWFDDRGMLLKQTQEGEITGKGRTFKTSTEYEYDPTIKIEAPIL